MLAFQRLLLAIVALFALVLSPSSSEAQRKNRSPSSSSTSSQKAKVLINGAMVFRYPTFDSDVVAYLPKNKIYRVSVKKRGPFFKILYAPKKYGWIVDVDVETELQGRAGKGAKKEKDLNAAAEAEVDRITEVVTEEEKNEEIYFTRYIGPIFASVDFTENTLGGTWTDSLMMYGLKVAGPRVLFDTPTLTEFTLLAHFGAPGYYEKITGNPAEGLLLLADLLITAPFWGGENYMFYYSMGPLVRWNKFQIKAGKTSLDLQDIHLGAVIELGAALQIQAFALRLEYRYYWEVTRHTGLGLSLQTKF